jgi:formylglycine-generating enzyme required for sulfatase activity
MPRPEIDWVEVPAGEFMMGSDPEVDSDADPDEAPPHKVYLDAYRISRYEITNAQYARCVRATVCEEPGDLAYYSDQNYANHPVVYVSWFNAKAFCRWMGGRLPTEAEWEYAARGPEGHVYPWGNDLPSCEWAQFGGCAGDLAPVGTRPDGASWCGTEDMAGNVWEWTADWYGPYPYEHQENPTGPGTGESKVERGGSFDFDQGDLRAADRVNDPPGLGYFNIGFRCVGPPGK